MTPSSEEQAMIRCACMKAELTIGQVIGALSLLVSDMGDSREPAGGKTRNRWATIAMWLSDRLQLEGENLADSLIHDELVAAKAET